MTKSDKKFAQDAKALFDTSIDELDAATLSKLNQARHRAIAGADARRADWFRWVPAAGTAAAALVIAMVILPGPTSVDVVPTSVTDMEILLGEDSIDMLEDLEFYAWIDLLEEDDDVG